MDAIKNALIIAMLLLPGAITAHAAGNTNIVVMLGDSTTLCSRNKPGAKLTELVQAYLTQKKLQAVVVNSGVGSDTAKGGFNRLEKAVLVHSPDVVTISFGLNDTGLFTPDEYRDWMEKILQEIQAKSKARILLVTSTPFNNAKHAWRKKFADKGGLDEYMDANICAATRELAKKHNLKLCDLHAFFLEKFEGDPKLVDELIMPDGVHLTDRGNEVAAGCLAPAIAEILAEKNK
ncbi:MAG: GDSL-type esterase/lipase family protein [Kiritimatiellia bacterium]